MKDNKEATIRNFEIVDRLRAIREELVGMKLALDEFTYEDVDDVRTICNNLKQIQNIKQVTRVEE